jgi:phospholipid/cholesterol/gamma-HCH transport system substrate-binding protein
MGLFNRKVKKGQGRRGVGFSPAKAGVIAIVVIALATFWGFTRFNPFSSPYELKATFHNVNNLQPKSPVRIAGVNVGTVKEVKPLGGGKGATVTMEIMDTGLPIHKDAELKIRPRIFLEGNFFVDIQPGSASTEVADSGYTVPVQQTATPVQLGDLLTALQSDTREDLRTLIFEYSVKGLGNGGAEAYNESLDHAAEAFKSSAIANDATLGERPHDLSNVLRGQQRLSAALASNPAILKDLVTQLNVTFAAFAREDSALRATIPALRDVLRVGTPALVSLDSALPSLRAFARDALPGTISSGPTIDASLPFVHQARLLVRPEELGGLVADLRPTIPALARLNRATIPFLNENRALSACQNNVLLPFAKEPIPDPDFPQNSGEPFYKQGPRGFVGLAGESRLMDANTPMFHAQINAGSATIQNVQDDGQGVFAQAAAPPKAVRPARPASRPKFRPDIPCETQEPPDLNAVGAGPDATLTNSVPGGLLPPLPLPFNQKVAAAGQAQMKQLTFYLRQKAAGKPAVDPLATTPENYVVEMKKIGYGVTPKGAIYKLETEAGNK